MALPCASLRGRCPAPFARRRDLPEMHDNLEGVSPVPLLPQPPSGVLREAKPLGGAHPITALRHLLELRSFK